MWTPETLWVISACAAAVAGIVSGLIWLVDRILQHCWLSSMSRDILSREGAAGLEHLVPLVKAQRPKKKRLSLPRRGP